MKIKLDVRNISFSYNSAKTLRDVCFRVGRGRLVSLVGPNGSGKSTLLRCVNNILSPEHGRIMVDEREVRRLSRMETARTLTYVPQSIHRVFPHTVFDVVHMGRRPHLGWKTGSRDAEKVWETLDLLGLVDLAMNSFTELSGGQQQKVLIARALAQETGLVLLDEPTSNLDLWHQLDVLNIVLALVEKRDVTVIMAMHDLNMAAKHSHDLIMLKNGRVVAAGPPQTVLTRSAIAEVYNVDARVERCDGLLYVIPVGQRPLRRA